MALKGSPLLTLNHTLTHIMNTPDYNPCRKFRVGDIVTPCQVNGRWWAPAWKDRSGILYEVIEAECPDSSEMTVKDETVATPFEVHAAFFKLVTPVEELEPYRLDNDTFGWIVLGKGGFIAARFWQDYHPNAKASAEAECKRLNAEHRKSTINNQQ